MPLFVALDGALHRQVAGRQPTLAQANGAIVGLDDVDQPIRIVVLAQAPHKRVGMLLDRPAIGALLWTRLLALAITNASSSSTAVRKTSIVLAFANCVDVRIALHDPRRLCEYGQSVMWSVILAYERQQGVVMSFGHGGLLRDLILALAEIGLKTAN